MKKIISLVICVTFILVLFTACEQQHVSDMPSHQIDNSNKSSSALKPVYEAIERQNYEEAYSLLQTIEGHEAQELKNKFVHIVLSEEFENSNGKNHTTYVYDENGYLLREVDPNSNHEYEVLYTYDNNGNLLSEKSHTKEIIYTYNVDSQVLTEKKYEKSLEQYTYTYTYDKNGNMLTKTFISPRQHMEFRYTYTNDNVLISMEEWENHKKNGEEVYKYDKNGNMISSIYTFNDGDSWKKETFKYNNDGKILTEELEYDSGLGKKHNYTYNSQGKILTATEIQHDGDWEETVCTYDSDGNCLTLEKTSSGGTHDTYIYTYDKKGRIITKEFYGEYNNDRQNTVYTYDDENKQTLFKRTYDDGSVETKIYTWEIMYYPKAIPDNIPVLPTNTDMMYVQID